LELYASSSLLIGNLILAHALVDSLLKEIGLNGSDIQGLTAGVAIANHDEKTEASK